MKWTSYQADSKLKRISSISSFAEASVARDPFRQKTRYSHHKTGTFGVGCTCPHRDGATISCSHWKTLMHWKAGDRYVGLCLTLPLTLKTLKSGALPQFGHGNDTNNFTFPSSPTSKSLTEIGIPATFARRCCCGYTASRSECVNETRLMALNWMRNVSSTPLLSLFNTGFKKWVVRW